MPESPAKLFQIPDSQKLYEVIDVCCFKSLNFEGNFYTSIDNYCSLGQNILSFLFLTTTSKTMINHDFDSHISWLVKAMAAVIIPINPITI